MYKLSKPPARHPAEVAALRELATVAEPLQDAWFKYYAVCEELGVEQDPYTQAVGEDALALVGSLEAGPPDPEDFQRTLRDVAQGWLVPVFDSEGNPAVRDGQQMYTHPFQAKEIEAAVGSTVEWLKRTDAPERAVEFLRSAHPGLQPDEEVYVARQAGKILRDEGGGINRGQGGASRI